MGGVLPTRLLQAPQEQGERPRALCGQNLDYEQVLVPGRHGRKVDPFQFVHV